MKIHKLKLLILSCCILLVAACTKEDPDLAKGKEIYSTVCIACHAQGLNGAPRFANNIQWGPRKAQGLDVLVEHASNGFGLMPAKGGRTELTDDDIRAAVKYMLSALEE